MDVERRSRRPLDVRTLTKVSLDLFHAGRRTISYLDYVEAYERNFDATFTARVVEYLPAVVAELEVHGVHCILVNEFCLRHFAEMPVTNIAEARRCNVYNSGGKLPVGIRRALPDDLVRGEVPHSLTKLGMGAVEHAVKDSVNDKATGVTPPESHDRLIKGLKEKLPGLLEIEPDLRQQNLLPATDDDLLPTDEESKKPDGDQ